MKRTLILFLVFICILTTVIFFTSCTNQFKFKSESYLLKPNDVLNLDSEISNKFDYTLSVENTSICSIDGHRLIALKEGITYLFAKTNDGTKEISTKIIVSNEITPGDDVIVTPTYLVSFYLVNDKTLEVTYQEYFEKDSLIDEYLPTYVGYNVFGWFTDKECKNKYDESTPITDAINLYCYRTEKENSFIFTEDKYVRTLLYPNLSHSVIRFPEKTLTGETCLGIADFAFANDTEIEEIYIPSSYEYIGNSAFGGCTNLKKVVFAENSKLKTIGRLAFSVTRTKASDSDGTDDDEVEYELNNNPCENLTTINLPDSVKSIGTFAFYKCTSLNLNNIPSGLTKITQGAFWGTKITNVDLKNVSMIYSYAFTDCQFLETITNASNVVYVGKEAFTNSKYFNDSINSNNGLVYIEDILVGCSNLYGKLLGGSRFTLKPNTRLIANNAFTNSKNQYELSIYFPDNNLIDIGTNAFFTNVSGVALIVPDSLYNEYTSTYTAYKNIFCRKIDYVLTNDKQVNYGTHRIIVYDDGTTCYDQFIPSLADNDKIVIPKKIDLSLNINLSNCNRIQTHAIDLSNVDTSISSNLTYVNLGKINNVAFMAICNCPKLSIIDIESNQTIVNLEDSNSIQTSSIDADYSIMVSKSNIEAYKSAWESHKTAVSKLRYFCNIQTNVLNPAYAAITSDYFGTIRIPNGLTINNYLVKEIETEYEYIVVWYLDSNKTTPITDNTIFNNDSTIYAYLQSK